MAITNPQDILNEGVDLPLAIEAILPAGAPKISVIFTQFAASAPSLPDFPAPLPDLPNFGITGAALSSINVTPSSPGELGIGGALEFTATSTYADGSTADITSQVTWASSDTTIATIDSRGVATGVAAGSTDITASLGGISSPAVTLTVSSTVIVRQPITIIWE